MLRRFATSGRVVRAVTGSPALRRVLPAFLAYNAAVYGTWVAILVYAYNATGAASVGLVALVQLLPAGALAPLMAVLADRHPRERVLLAGYLLQAAGYAATATGMLLGAPPVVVYACGAGLAVATTLTRPAQGALLPSLARTPEELTAANSAAGTAEGLGVLVGPLAAAGILAVASPGAVWACGAIVAIVAARLVAGLPTTAIASARGSIPAGERRPTSSDTAQGAHAHDHGRGHAAAGPADPSADLTGASASDAVDTGDEVTVAGSAWSLMAEGFRAVALADHTRLVVALLGVRMLSSGAIDVMFVLLALQVFGTGDAGAGILTGALGLGLVLGGATSLLLIGRQRLAPALAASALAWSIPLILVATVAPVIAAPALIAVAGIGFATIDVVGRTLLQRVTPDRKLARVLGALEGIGLVFVASGSLLAPGLAAAAGTDRALIVVALLLPAAVALAWLPLRHIDRDGNVPVRAMTLLRDNVIFAPLSLHQVEAVARRTRWMTLGPGEVLIRQGDVGDRYYVLESGSLSITIDGRFVITVDGAGEGVGEVALLHDVRRTATVTGVTQGVLLVLERADFLLAVTGHDLVAEAAAMAAARKMVPADPGRPTGP